MKQGSLFSPAGAAESGRDDGIEEVTREDWQERALRSLGEYAGRRGEFLIEEFRDYWLSVGGDPPHSHNAWGALARVAAKENVIEWTGAYRATRSAKTHAHPAKLWKARS